MIIDEFLYSPGYFGRKKKWKERRTRVYGIPNKVILSTAKKYLDLSDNLSRGSIDQFSKGRYPDL